MTKYFAISKKAKDAREFQLWNTKLHYNLFHTTQLQSKGKKRNSLVSRGRAGIVSNDASPNQSNILNQTGSNNKKYSNIRTIFKVDFK